MRLGQPFEEGSSLVIDVQAGQLWTAASLLQMTNHRLPLDPFPSTASGVQSASPQMAPGLEGCPPQAGTHQSVCLLAKPWALQKHGLWAGSFLTTLPSQENIHFSFKQSAADRGLLHVKYHPTVQDTQVLCLGTPSPVAALVIWHIASECLYLEQDPNQAKLLVA